MELFILGEDKLANIDKVWISTISEFREILKRDKDRYKKQAIAEFTFIYHFLDYRSPFRNYTDVEKVRACLKNAGLPEDFEYNKDNKLVEAMNMYRSLTETKTLKFIRGAFRATDALTDYYNTVTVGNSKSAKELTSSIKDTGAMIANLKELEEQVQKELSEASSLRGESVKGYREDPK